MKGFYKATVPHELLKATENNTRKKERKEWNLIMYSSDLHQRYLDCLPTARRKWLQLFSVECFPISVNALPYCEVPTFRPVVLTRLFSKIKKNSEQWWNDTDRENMDYAEKKFCPIANMSKTKLTWTSSKYKPRYPQLKPATDWNSPTLYYCIYRVSQEEWTKLQKSVP